jgi:hypothetical protein
MKPSFQFHALAAETFRPLFEMSDAQLATLGARQMVADEKPGYPCRISLADAEVGEPVWLLTFSHHDVASPYRASGPIFVRRGVDTANPAVNEIPKMLLSRQLSIRAYDSSAMMVGAAVTDGRDLEQNIIQFLSRDDVEYLHIHNARPGCFNCRVTRAD